MNPASIFKLKGAWDKFTAAHPKFPGFLQAASSGMIEAGSVIDIKITSPDGKTIATNMKLTQEDMELFATLKDLK